MQRHVWYALPAYTGMIHLGTMRCIWADMIAFAERGDKVTVFDECGNALLADGRALMVAKFLESDGTDLVFVDHDVIWQAGATLRLVDAPVDFVAGIYPQRADPIKFSFQLVPEHKELWADPETKLLEVAGVPAGFMRVSRSALERMTEHYKELEFYCVNAPNRRAVALFESIWEMGREMHGSITNVKYGEDFSFCRRWRDMGGKVWIDPELKMGHVGNKTFVGSIGDWFRENMVQEHDRQDAA